MKLWSIQVLRGLAACGVVLSHSMGLAIGAFGVDLFFVISGYVMVVASKDKTAGQFLLDRMWRIYPIYWVALLPWFFFTPDLTATKFLSSITLWPIYGSYFSQSYLTVAWTLSFEMLFYVSFAFSLWVRSPAVPLSIFLSCMGAMLVFPNALFGFLGSPMIFLFLCGIGLTFAPLQPRLAIALLPLAAILLAMSDASFLARQEIRPDPLRQFGRLLWWGLPAVIIFYAARCHEHLFTSWAKPFVALGAASYSIYLFHLLAITETHWLVDTVLAIALGIAAWWLIERRILAARPRLRRLSGERAPSTARLS